MFRNVFLASVVAMVLVVGAVQPARAQVTLDVQAQIQALVARIQQLTALLEQLRANAGNAGTPSQVLPIAPGLQHRLCSIMYRNLAPGTQGDDVQSLQEFLRDQGFFNLAPTGYFGTVTGDALRRWQIANGVDAEGVFGPITRERIRAWCGGIVNNNSARFSASPTQGTAPLAVTFSSMVGGFRPAGITYEIDYGDGSAEPAAECSAPADACVSPGTNTHTYTQNGTYVAQLIRKTANTCSPTASTVCAAWVNSEEVIGTATITVGDRPQICTLEYAPVCGQIAGGAPQTYGNRCAMNAAGATFLYEGQCKATQDPGADPQCKTWYDGCNTCSRSTPGGVAACTLRACFTQNPAYCTSRFDTSTSNRAPDVRGVSGPTTLPVGQTGTWTVTASDPENGPLSYAVNWGDVGFLGSFTAALPVQQTSTFTHSYAQPGTYTVRVTVTDDKGASTETSITVEVTSSDVACTREYAPVCGQPPMPQCNFGFMCAQVMPQPQTYNNRCLMNAAGASLLYEGQCTDNQIIACTADAYLCPNGQWVGRTGPNCQFVCN